MYKKKKPQAEAFIIADSHSQIAARQSNRYVEYDLQQISPTGNLQGQAEAPLDRQHATASKDNFFNLFGQNSASGNVEYVNKLMMQNKGITPNSKDARKKGSHQRTKSSNLDPNSESANMARTERRIPSFLACV
jgi:hypothetical protein